MPIEQDIIAAIESWDPLGDNLQWPDERFEDLAGRLFAHQYTHNSVYRTFCERRGLSPDDEPHSTAIPAVPTDAFKHVRLVADDKSPTHTFRTSGTTGDARGEHHFLTLDVYRASLHPAFLRFCNPDHRPLRILILAPPPADLEDSSLSFMLGELVARHGDHESRFFVTLDGHGQWKIDAPGFAEALDTACADGATTLVFGTAFAYAAVFDDLDNNWQLPKGSRLVETGGFKGRTQTLSRHELYTAFTDRLGISSSHCLSEYSMTELSSQTYTDQLRAALGKKPTATGRFYAPPWLDIQVVDPVDLSVCDEPGVTGLIRFFDLANVDSVSAVQTSDRGIIHDDGGLELLGRAPDAELRGCSLTIEEIVAGK